MADVLDVVNELLSLNDENLANRVVANNDVQWCLSELYDFLTADVAPVVHGRWKRNDGMYTDTVCCSVCGEEYEDGYDMAIDGWAKYCPNCGARMDLEVEDAIKAIRLRTKQEG